MATRIEEPSGFQPLRLREASQAAGLTQQGVATALGLSMRGVQSWFLGQADPSGDNLVALARLLGRRPEWFYGHDEEEVAA